MLGPLVPLKGKVNTTANKDILYRFRLPTLWEQFMQGPLLIQHECATVHKARPIKTWYDNFGVKENQGPSQSTFLNPISRFGMNFNICCKPDLHKPQRHKYEQILFEQKMTFFDVSFFADATLVSEGGGCHQA